MKEGCGCVITDWLGRAVFAGLKLIARPLYELSCLFGPLPGEESAKMQSQKTKRQKEVLAPEFSGK